MEMAWRPWLLWQATCVLTAAVAVPDRGHKAGALVCLWEALCDSRSVCVLCTSVVPLLAARVLHCKCVPRCRCLGMCSGVRGARGVYGAVLHGCRVLQQPDAHRHSLLLLCSALHCGCQEQSLWPSGLGVTLLLLSGLRPGFGACLCGGSCNCLVGCALWATMAPCSVAPFAALAVPDTHCCGREVQAHVCAARTLLSWCVGACMLIGVHQAGWSWSDGMPF